MRDYSFVFEQEDDELKYELMRQLGKTDLFFLAKYILNYKDLEETTDLHHRLCDILQDDPLRYLVLIFRGSFKTSLGIAWVIQCLIKYPGIQIGIGSDTKERAAERVLDIRQKLEENELLKILYPDVFFQSPTTDSDLWKKDEFNVIRPLSGEGVGGFRKPSVSCFGLVPLPTGSHYDIVLVDDVENEENCSDDEKIQQLTRNFGAFIPTLNPGAKLVMLGTIYCEGGPNTIYQEKWPTYKRAVVDSYGFPTFPSRFNEEVIAQYKSDINDDYLWKGQYLLKAAKRTDKFFYPFIDVKLKKFKLVNDVILYDGGEVRLSDCILYLTVDPGGGASKEQKERQPKVIVDECGFCLNAVDVANHWFILRMWQEHLSDEQLVEMLFSLYGVWSPYMIGVEKMPHLDAYLRLAFRMRGKSLPVTELLPKKRPKSDRIRASKPMLNDAYFNEKDALSLQQHFRDWYTEQEHGDNDFDAWAYQLDIARPPTIQQLTLRKKQLQEADD